MTLNIYMHISDQFVPKKKLTMWILAWQLTSLNIYMHI